MPTGLDFVKGEVSVEAVMDFNQLPRVYKNKFRSADTTPSVSNVETWEGSGSVVSVTYFDDGQEGQPLKINGDGTTTVVHNVSKIRTNTGSNKLLTVGFVYRFTRFAGVWIEDAAIGGGGASIGDHTHPADQITPGTFAGGAGGLFIFPGLLTVTTGPLVLGADPGGGTDILRITSGAGTGILLAHDNWIRSKNSSGTVSKLLGVANGTSTVYVGGIDAGITALSLRASASERWLITTAGHFISGGGVDNTYDFGAVGATRPRTGYFGTSVIVSTDPGGSGGIRIGGGLSLTGAVEWLSSSTSRWTIGLSGVGGLQIKSEAGAANTHTFWLDSGNNVRASLDNADGTLILGTDPGGAQLLRVGGGAIAYLNAAAPSSPGSLPTSHIVSITDSAYTTVGGGQNFFGVTFTLAAAQITLNRSRGTMAAPSPLLSGDAIAAFWAGGQYDTTPGHIAPQVAGMRVRAAENWSATTQGTNISWANITLGSVTQVEALQLTGTTAFGPTVAGGLTLGLGATLPWGKGYFGLTAFSNARGFVNVRADHNVDNSIYLEDSNGSPFASWAIGLGTGDGVDGLGFYNYTAPALRMALRASGQLNLPAGPLIVGTDPGSSETVRIGGTMRLGNTSTSVLGSTFTIASSVSSGANVQLLAAGRIDFAFYDSAAALDSKRWDFSVDGAGGANSFLLAVRNDAGVLGDNAIQVIRSANTISDLRLFNNRAAFVTSTLEFSPMSAGGLHLGTVALPWADIVAAAGLIRGTGPELDLYRTGSALDEKNWDWIVGATFMDFRAVNDANSIGNTWIRANRSGVTISSIQFYNGSNSEMMRLTGAELRPASAGLITLGTSGQRWGKLWGQDASFSLDVTMDVLGTFDHTGTRFTSGAGPVADDIMSWHAGAGKWRPRFFQTQFTSGVVVAQNNLDSTFSNFAFSVTYNNITPSVPATPIVTPIYGGFIIDMGALPPAGSSYVVDYSINGAAFSTDKIIFTSQKAVHTIINKNGTLPFLSTDNFSYKAKGRGSANGTHDSAYSAASANANYVVTTEVNAFGLVVASQISAVYLSAITANVGSITAGQLVSGDGKSILQLDSTFSIPGTVTQGVFFASANPPPGGITGMYLDFTATGANHLFHHSKIDLNADGTATFKGLLDISSAQLLLSYLNAYLVFRNPGLAHGMTDIVPTDVSGAVFDWGTTSGGVQVAGFSSTATNIALKFLAVNGGASGAVPVMSFEAGKKLGVSYSSAASSDLLFTWYNVNTLLFRILGDGSARLTGDLTLDARLKFSTAAAKIIPGATSLSIRNNADTVDNLLILDAGGVNIQDSTSGLAIGSGGSFARIFLNVGAAHRPWKIGAQDATTEALEFYRAQANNADARAAAYDIFASFDGALPAFKLGAGLFMEMTEISAPGTPGANKTFDYTKDLGGVSTRYYRDDAGVEHPHNLTLIDTQTFTATGAGTWTKPAGAVLVRVVVVGAGGGGGGGRGGAAGSIRQGGGGGGGGAMSERWYNATNLGATEGVSVGVGGTSGNGGSSVDGSVGGNGGDSWFGNAAIGSAKQWAYGGGGGGFGSTVTDRCGGSGGGWMSAGSNGGTVASGGGAPGRAAGADGQGGGGAGNTLAGLGSPALYGGGSGGGVPAAANNAFAGGCSQFGGGGGGGGGSITAANSATAGQPGGDNDVGTTAGGGAANTAGANGDNFRAGQGGGGGTAQTGGTGTAGGAGGAPGGGGGGGGGGTTIGGAGGAGGRGEVRVYSYA